MAKKRTVLKAVESSVDVELLKQIGSGQVQQIDRDNAMPLLQHQPPLIECGSVDMQSGMAPCRLSEAGQHYLNGVHGSPAKGVEEAVAKTEYGIITNATLPPSRRGQNLGGGGAPVKYPFDALEVGGSFFVPATEKRPDPLKVLGATVSSANMRYAEETGEMRTVTRAKRGEKNRAVRDEHGEKIMETKQVPVYNFSRKFEIRGVEAGKSYGAWVAPADGVLIGRVK
jgi:hypothetical protein